MPRISLKGKLVTRRSNKVHVPIELKSHYVYLLKVVVWGNQRSVEGRGQASIDTSMILYKIGYSYNPSKRVSWLLKDITGVSITILKVKLYKNKEIALAREQELLKKYKKYRYYGKKVLASGNTELFRKELVELSEAISI